MTSTVNNKSTDVKKTYLAHNNSLYNNLHKLRFLTISNFLVEASILESEEDILPRQEKRKKREQARIEKRLAQIKEKAEQPRLRVKRRFFFLGKKIERDEEDMENENE